jgi:diguanylate cyclase (GGDEF)-like protein/putative nucleotidyltransferase with HDIG domain
LRAGDPQLGVPRITRISLILWGIGGATSVALIGLYLGRVDSRLFFVLLIAVLASIFGLTYYSYCLYLRALDKVTKHANDMGDLFNSTLSTLALAIDAKDKHTHGHTRRVQKYARAIAEGMRLTATQIKAITDAALLHDIGKLAIPEYILNKRGPLTPEEMGKMRKHPQFGADIIANIRFPYPVCDSVLAHHERFDGTGYPKGLRGNEIPLGARVLAVADSFDGYISDRMESKETLEGAIRFVCEGAGTAFDPEVVAVWERIYPDVVVWPSYSESDSYKSIQQAQSELKMLETLTRSIEGITSVNDIIFKVRRQVMRAVPGCEVTIERGERLGVPIVFGDKVIATISAHRAHIPLNEDEFRLVHAIAETVAPMLGNAMVIEEARRDATLDKLTGLPNRRAFEMMSASLNRQHCSIVLIDVNCFKAVNDNFGHNAGDATLVRIAAHLRAAFHDAELTSRLGGDEFLVLSFGEIRSLRAQVRRFRQMVVWDPAHEPYKRLFFGVSCGIASIPVDAKNIEHAVQIADQRMYAIKARFKQLCARGSTASARRGRELAVT